MPLSFCLCRLRLRLIPLGDGVTPLFEGVLTRADCDQGKDRGHDGRDREVPREAPELLLLGTLPGYPRVLGGDARREELVLGGLKISGMSGQPAAGFGDPGPGQEEVGLPVGRRLRPGVACALDALPPEQQFTVLIQPGLETVPCLEEGLVHDLDGGAGGRRRR